LRKRPLAPDAKLPRVPEVARSVAAAGDFEEYVDIELCYTIMLHAFWRQISAYREAIKFHQIGSLGDSTSTHQLWIKSQYQELYRDLNNFSTMLYASGKSMAKLALIVELFMMILHVSPDDLQKFAGKAGVEEARLMTTAMEEGWVKSSEARYAAWHAGQVLHNARRLPPTSLRRFNAMAVYLASLTLWIYGLLSTSHQPNGIDEGDGMDSSTGHVVLLDGDESRETKAFLQFNRGIPSLSRNGDPHSGVVPLSDPITTLSVASNVFRDNFPVRNEPLPPLVESLATLLRDLGNPPAARSSRSPSEQPA
jgi:hypothetical protein